MAEKLLTCSETFRKEYCCTVVRIGQLKPIEGSDFLAKTDVLGTQIVVRKDQVHEGDIMFYAANETQLAEKFLSLNNLFEIGARNLNSNAEEVNAIMSEYNEKYRDEADELKAKAKNIKNNIERKTKESNKLNKQIVKLHKEMDETADISDAEAQYYNDEIEKLQEIIDKNTKYCLEKTVLYTNYKNKASELVEAGKGIVDEAKKHCGFFNKYGRVRCITLKGEPSFGFIFSQKDMALYEPAINEINLEDYVDQDFDTVGGNLFVKVYVPPVKDETVGRRGKALLKRNKHINRFDRMIDGEFSFHYDTENLDTRNIKAISPQNKIAISVKLHGTSVIIGKVHVKQPKKIAFYKRAWNFLVDKTRLLKSTRFIDYDVVYGPVYSSRTVIKNKYINKEVTQGYYAKDVWSEWGDIVYPYLDDGMTIYGEIVGYAGNSPIQKCYDYGCKENENKLMIYRIVTANENGVKTEWNVKEVKEWTDILIIKMQANNDDNYSRIHPIDLLYNGTLSELYPDIEEDEMWEVNVLYALKNDKQHFGMEEYEPLCTYNNVPREGICIRIDNDTMRRCWKVKSVSYKFKEAILIDSGEVDMEMADNYSEEINNN